MNARADAVDWTEANQRALADEFARAKAMLSQRGDGERPVATVETVIDRLVDRFGLTTFERDVLLLCAGVEMDAELATLVAAAVDPASSGARPGVTFGLALALLPDAHWTALTNARPLRRWRLLDVDDRGSLVNARLRIDERVLHYLAGVDVSDARLDGLVRLVSPAEPMAPSQERIAGAIEAMLVAVEHGVPVVQLAGDDRDGRRDVAARVASRGGLALYEMDATDVPAAAHETDALTTLWGREAALLDAALLLDCASDAPAPHVLRFVERVGGLVFLSSREPAALDRDDRRYRVDKPDAAEQFALWTTLLGPRAADENVADIASEYRLSAQTVRRLAGRTGEGSTLRDDCRERSRLRLEGLAERIEPRCTLDDVVLPEPQRQQLRELMAQVRHRTTVHERWGFAARSRRGLGLAVLFAGDSGTGKTMAAEALAHELERDLYRIDLAAVVSKYIGETEKNLSRIFDAAEDGGAILLFDEADALFGKRSEVKDSHDRYANIEVSYLLQRMEAYRGIAILTTNQKSALDAAFERRLRTIVHFPFPDVADRAEIWRRAIPADAQADALDPDKLARLHASGGQIRNIAIAAAFHAADEGRALSMAHLLRAARGEAAKRQRTVSDAETRGWVT